MPGISASQYETATAPRVISTSWTTASTAASP